MGQVDYILCFEEAVRKAFAAQSPDARKAYLDLATFYRGKLPNADLPGLEESSFAWKVKPARQRRALKPRLPLLLPRFPPPIAAASAAPGRRPRGRSSSLAQ